MGGKIGEGLNLMIHTNALGLEFWDLGMIGIRELLREMLLFDWIEREWIEKVDIDS